MLVLVLGSLFLFYLLILLPAYHSRISTYENRSKAKYLVGGKNESRAFWSEFYQFLEADMDMDSFNRFAKLKKKQFIPIGDEGIDVPCYKFKSIHPNQKNDFDNFQGPEEWDRKWHDICYHHHVANGFYFFENELMEDPPVGGIATVRLIVYDIEHCRIFDFCGFPEWVCVPQAE